MYSIWIYVKCQYYFDTLDTLTEIHKFSDSAGIPLPDIVVGERHFIHDIWRPMCVMWLCDNRKVSDDLCKLVQTPDFRVSILNVQSETTEQYNMFDECMTKNFGVDLISRKVLIEEGKNKRHHMVLAYQLSVDAQHFDRLMLASRLTQ